MLFYERMPRDININLILGKILEFYRFNEIDYIDTVDRYKQNNIEPKEVFLLKDYENNKENSNVNLDWR